jgi:hypothetical protein
MNKMQRHIISWSIVAIGVAIVAYIIYSQINPASQQTGKYDSFATCLTQKGMIFYGAFWCPHCQNIKREFGESAMKSVTYVECSTPDGRGQTEACASKKIEGYPTFEFADGSRISGEVPFQKLAEKTGCTLPDSSATSATPTSTTSTVQ